MSEGHTADTTAIAEAAFYLWLEEGQPQGRDQEFWLRAEQTLNAANYATARAALQGMKGDYGRPLGIMPKLLVVPPALESAGRKILNSEYAAGGKTNEWKGTAELLVVPWLA